MVGRAVRLLALAALCFASAGARRMHRIPVVEPNAAVEEVEMEAPATPAETRLQELHTQMEAEMEARWLVHRNNTCFRSILHVADSDDVYKVTQRFSPIPKRLHSRLSNARGRDGAAVGISEHERLFTLSTTCYLNARWVAAVMGMQEPDVPTAEAADAQAEDWDAADGVVSFASPRALRTRMVEHAEEDDDEPLAFYFSLPWQYVHEDDAGKRPQFYYYTHYFVVQQVPGADGPTYVLYAGFANHYRVIDWLRGGAGTGGPYGGGRAFSKAEMVDEILPLLDDYMTDINDLHWTQRTSFIHWYLFSIDKLGDMHHLEGGGGGGNKGGAGYGHVTQARMRRPTTRELKKRWQEALETEEERAASYAAERYEDTSGNRYKMVVHRFRYSDDDCVGNAIAFHNLYYRAQGAAPRPEALRSSGPFFGLRQSTSRARALLWDCATTRWHHWECDDGFQERNADFFETVRHPRWHLEHQHWNNVALNGMQESHFVVKEDL